MRKALPRSWVLDLTSNAFVDFITLAVPTVPRFLGNGWAPAIFHDIGPNEVLVVILHDNPVIAARSPVQKKTTLPVRRAAIAEAWL
jgi:hypothetical protein